MSTTPTAQIGLPYAPAGVDENGAYFVTCPEPGCGSKFFGIEGDDLPKDAQRKYGLHYEATHFERCGRLFGRSDAECLLPAGHRGAHRSY
jgi:hypothetical protein